jgi:hypothetical protein
METYLIFRVGNGVAHRRRRHMQSFGGFNKIALLYYRLKYSAKRQSHFLSPG